VSADGWADSRAMSVASDRNISRTSTLDTSVSSTFTATSLRGIPCS
jgi:hypothetical protein